MSQQLTIDGLVYGIFGDVLRQLVSTQYGWAVLAIFILGATAQALLPKKR